VAPKAGTSAPMAAKGAVLQRVDFIGFVGALRGNNVGSITSVPSQELLEVVAATAYAFPLPTSWSEQADSEGRVYFWHERRMESTWQHPLMPTFQATLAVMAELEKASMMQDITDAVAAHLKKAEERALQVVTGWTGPHAAPRRSSDGQQEFYYNERTSESSWENPIEAAQYELFVQFELFVRCLSCLDRKLRATSPTGTVRYVQAAGRRPAGRVDGKLPEFSDLELGFPSFLDQELPAACQGQEGLLESIVSSKHPTELEEYVRWIRLLVASAVPSVEVATALEAKRSTLPPLTELSLNCSPGDGRKAGSLHSKAVDVRKAAAPMAKRKMLHGTVNETAQAEVELQEQKPGTPPKQRSASVAVGLGASASIPMLPKKRSLPPLTAVPLQRLVPAMLQRPMRHRSVPALTPRLGESNAVAQARSRT